MTSMHPWKIVEVVPIHERAEAFMRRNPWRVMTYLIWAVLAIALLRMSWPSEVLSLQASDPEVMAGKIHQLELRVKELGKR